MKENKYIKALELSSKWFINNQNEKFLHYKYYPFRDIHGGGDDVSHIRDLGSLTAIIEIVNYLGDEKLKGVAFKGLYYYRNFFLYDKNKDSYYIDIVPGKIDLGSQAFIIICLINIDYPDKDKYLRGFAKGILDQQDENGKINTYFFRPSLKANINFFPGEALLALIRLYKYTEDDIYLEAVKKGFNYYRDYWRNNKNDPFIPWHTIAYSILYKITKDSEASDFIFEMTEYALQNFPKIEKVNGYSIIGGKEENYDFEKKGASTGGYIEGFVRAYEIAKILGNKDLEYRLKKFIKDGLDSLLKLQIQEKQFYLDDKAIGGFLHKRFSASMRIDINQHISSAIIASLENKII